MQSILGSLVALLLVAATALAQNDIDEPMPVPHALPVPDHAAPFAFEPQVVPPAVLVAAVLRSFPALADNNTAIPPDTNGAVGTNHLVVTLNSQVQVQTRAGAAVQTLSLRTFFDPVRQNGRVFDPHISFDARAGRWIATAIGDQKTTSTATRTGSGLLLAISDGIDPTGHWSEYRFDAPSGVWFDYPILGYDDAKITISINVYALADDKFQHATIFVIPRASPASAVKFDLTSNFGGALAPTVSLDSGTVTYLLQAWNSNSAGAGYLRLYSVSMTAITPVAFVSSPAPWAYQSDGDLAPQLGRTQKIDAGDDRVNGAVLRNGAIWGAQTIYLPAGSSPNRTSVQWWQVSSTGTVMQRGTIDDPSGEFFYAYPGIAVNRRNDAIVGFSRFSATTFASTGFATRVGSDPANAMSAPFVFKNGEAPYYKVPDTSSSTRNRWGDYSAAVVDPLNDIDFWAIEEYAALPGATDRWGTWWVQVTPAVPPRRRAATH